MWGWITTNANPVMAVAAVLGLLATVVGFGLTIYQLHVTASQLQSANEYGIRKDLRELVGNITPKMKLDCLQDGKTCNADEIKDTKQSLGLLFNFYHSVFRQAEASGISDGFEAQMKEDFCASFKRPPVLKFWNDQVAAGNYDEERKRMKVEWCG